MENVSIINVSTKIYKVMADLPWVGKDGEMKGGAFSYQYATEAAFISALRPLFIKHKLIIMPIDLSTNFDKVEVKDRYTYLTNIQVIYRIIDVDSGEYIDIKMAGAGNDSGDKAIYKALTGSFKYALRETFLIGTGDDPEGSLDNSENSEHSSDEEESVIHAAITDFKEKTKLQIKKSHIVQLKQLGYVFSDDNGKEEKFTAKMIRRLAERIINGGLTLEESIAELKPIIE